MEVRIQLELEIHRPAPLIRTELALKDAVEHRMIPSDEGFTKNYILASLHSAKTFWHINQLFTLQGKVDMMKNRYHIPYYPLNGRRGGSLANAGVPSENRAKRLQLRF